MLYIVTALKPEAQAFVDRYKLKKETLGNYKIFTNKEMKLIISGLGTHNAMLATQTLIDYFDITNDDIYINVGICAANFSYKIGELLHISKIMYNGKEYLLNAHDEKTISCSDKEVSENIYEIADMESFGFYDAVVHSPAIKNRYMFKVVSDHFEPSKVTKDATKSLIFNALNDIDRVVKKSNES